MRNFNANLGLSAEDDNLHRNFRMQSSVELDFIIGHDYGFPVGTQSQSPPEFRRRVLAAMLSYRAGLKSIDYTLKKYVDPDQYEADEASLGDAISGYLHACTTVMEDELKKLHTVEGLNLGIFGAEITWFRIPYSLDMARMLSNRGLLLEVVPILRLCLEMISWGHVAFQTPDENKVMALKAQSCISSLRHAYQTSGKVYGFLSRFAHWEFVVHRHFLLREEERVGVLKASVRYRAIGLALCLVVVDILVEVIRAAYSERADDLIRRIQGCLSCDVNRNVYQHISKMAEASGLHELREIQLLLR